MHNVSPAQRSIYLRALLQRYDTLSLPLGTALSFSLTQVFQPLRLRQSSLSEGYPRLVCSPFGPGNDHLKRTASWLPPLARS